MATSNSFSVCVVDSFAFVRQMDFVLRTVPVQSVVHVLYNCILRVQFGFQFAYSILFRRT